MAQGHTKQPSHPHVTASKGQAGSQRLKTPTGSGLTTVHIKRKLHLPGTVDPELTSELPITQACTTFGEWLPALNVLAVAVMYRDPQRTQ